MKRFGIFGKGNRVIVGDMVGGSVVIDGKTIMVDGKVVCDDAEGVVELRISGGSNETLNIESSASVTVKGDVTGNIDAGMSVTCGNVGGDVTAKMSVNCDNIGGNATSKMSITANDIYGNASSKMSINAARIGSISRE